MRSASSSPLAKPAPGAKQDMRREAKQLKIESRQLERRAINDVLDQADVICATTTIDEMVFGDRHFDWVVVDEAHHVLPASWQPGHLSLPKQLDRAVLITLEPKLVAPGVLERVNHAIFVGETAGRIEGDGVCVVTLADRERAPTASAGLLDQLAGPGVDVAGRIGETGSRLGFLDGLGVGSTAES